MDRKLIFIIAMALTSNAKAFKQIDESEIAPERLKWLKEASELSKTDKRMARWASPQCSLSRGKLDKEPTKENVDLIEKYCWWTPKN